MVIPRSQSQGMEERHHWTLQRESREMQFIYKKTCCWHFIEVTHGKEHERQPKRVVRRLPLREQRPPTCSASDGRTNPSHLERVGERVWTSQVLGQTLAEDVDDDGVTSGRTFAHGALQLGRSGRGDRTRHVTNDHRIGARRSVVKAGPR